MMDFIIEGRQTGKTHQLVCMFLEDPEHTGIACVSEAEAERLRRIIQPRLVEKYRERYLRHLLLNNIFSYHNSDRHQGQDLEAVHVDNVDIILREIIRAGTIGTVTATGQVYRINPTREGKLLDTL